MGGASKGGDGAGAVNVAVLACFGADGHCVAAIAAVGVFCVGAGGERYDGVVVEEIASRMSVDRL